MGGRPEFVDRGLVDHVLVNIGTVDVNVTALTPLDPGIVVLGASSDYLVIDATAARRPLHVGDDVEFALGYAALVTAATSPYVEVVARSERPVAARAQ
jgi:predicted amino acid racemase